MARDHARILVAIWSDPDFVSLKSNEQHAYFLLVSNRGLSRAGVLDYIPSRFSGLANDLTEARFRKAIDGLRAKKFVVIDDRTQELLIRTYVRHDGVLDRVNMGKATGTAFESVVSDGIRRAVGRELHTLMGEKPTLPGWEGLAITSPTAHAMACGMESRKP